MTAATGATVTARIPPDLDPMKLDVDAPLIDPAIGPAGNGGWRRMA